MPNWPSAGLRFIKSDFVDFLGLFPANEKYITVTPPGQRRIDIRIVGPWLHTILFEIPVLAIINEVYFRNTSPCRLPGGPSPDEKLPSYGARAVGTQDRRAWLPPLFSRAWHDEVLPRAHGTTGHRPEPWPCAGHAWQLAGTSNTLAADAVGDHAAGHHGARIPAGRFRPWGQAPADSQGVRL